MTERSGESWVILLLEDLRDVARRENLPASAEAITLAIEVFRNETSAGPDNDGGKGAAQRKPPKPHH